MDGSYGLIPKIMVGEPFTIFGILILRLLSCAGLAHLIFKMLVGQMFQVLLSFVSKKENPFPTRYLGFR
jgi:hypothetical protein